MSKERNDDSTKTLIYILFLFLCLAIFMLWTMVKIAKEADRRPKEVGEMRVNPVINQLKQDLNGYYYKKESGSYYRLHPQ